MNLKNVLFDPGKGGVPRDLGLLVIRVLFAASLATAHGWGKLITYGERAATFPDPLGVGNPVSLALVVFAEFCCSIALALGFLGRLAALPLVINFGVAFFVFHAADPFGDKEMAFLYLTVFTGLLATGPGGLSIDRLIHGR